jgi:hypothetical protein
VSERTAGSGKSKTVAELVVTDAVKRCWRVEGEDETQVEAAQPAIKKNGSLSLDMSERAAADGRRQTADGPSCTPRKVYLSSAMHVKETGSTLELGNSCE